MIDMCRDWRANGVIVAHLNAFYLAIMTCGVLVVGVQAGEFPAYSLPHTEVRQLQSAATGVRYNLYISLPRDYPVSAARYPVVYTLDADYSFALAHNIIEHFTDRGDLPQMIVVSIAYEGASQDQTIYRINRVRDYAPTRQQLGGYGAEINKFSGEGVKFAQFLREELIPFIDSNYRTKDKDRTIVGHSLGGLFGTFMLFTQTEVFQRYILVSPSLWWSGYSGLRYEAEYAEKHADLSARVYYGIGGEEESYARPMVSTMEKLVATIEARAYQGLALKSDVLPGENHNSVFPGALVRGLRWVFRGE